VGPLARGRRTCRRRVVGSLGAARPDRLQILLVVVLGGL
jgi:hypothetical protein